MDDLRFGQCSDEFGFQPLNEDTGQVSGLYIPEALDCMRCGVCIGTCPTHQVLGEENQGPRGRVRMIERILRKNESLSDDELVAFDSCTLCRACEIACPSQMQFAELYRQAREVLTPQITHERAIEWLIGLSTGRRMVQGTTQVLMHIYQRSGLQRLVELRSAPWANWRLRRLSELIPSPYVSRPVPRRNPSLSDHQVGQVGLFTGCIGSILDTENHEATIRVLTRLGYNVQVIAEQTCCGAVYAHTGMTQRAIACARQNHAAFEASDVEMVIFNASGCGAFLDEYDTLLEDEKTRLPGQQAPETRDVVDFLLGAKGLENLKFRPLAATVAVHEPCSQRNVLKNQVGVYQLLDRIPGLKVVPLPGNHLCCGAGGTKMLTHPEIAIPLRDDKVEAFRETQADLLVSTNLNCALHLSSGIRNAGGVVKAVHPVQLMAQQLI